MIIATLLAVFALAPATRGAPVVGAARVDITPDGPIRLSGYAVRSEESRGIQHRISAQALAIGSDEEGPSLLVTVDNLGVPETITEELAARLLRRKGIARERLAVASSHTHSAPCLPGVAPNLFGKPIPAEQQARIDRYARDLVDRLETACVEALARRAPARLEWGRGRVDFAMNRRTPGGPVDHDVPVLRAVREDGKPVAVVVGYACHCTTIDPKENLIAGDWAAEAREAIEEDQPGAVAMVVIGCGADANPKDRPGQAVARRHGRSLAAEVARVCKGAMTRLDALPTGRIARVKLPFDRLPTRDELAALAAKGGAAGYNASTFLVRLDRGEPLPRDLDYIVQSWSFGEALTMVFLAGEVVVDYSTRLKAEYDPARVWSVAYANDDPCYIPSERILREGGYEGGGAMVYYGRPTRLAPGVEDRVFAAVREVVPPSFRAGAKAAAAPSGPRTPDRGLASIRIKAGLRVELVAAEPLVVDPVAIDWGSDGKLWVAEMRDYPAGIDGKYTPGGRIRSLADTDGDGRYDEATTFLDGLPFPTGVMAWRKGVLVCAAPEIFYAEDTDGDGKADIRKVLFSGFATENYQARVNGLALGLDGWVYGANGLIGGEIRGRATGRPIMLGSRDFRIRPDTGAFEPASGLTQQGRVRDDWGQQFGGNNSILLQHYPLPEHYAARNPHVAPPDPAVHVPRDPDSRRLYPATAGAERFNHPESQDQVTSACSPLIHRDPRLGPEYLGNAFVCEPVHNLITRRLLDPDGVTFSGRRAPDEQTSEFFASTDPWCRPVQVRTGPDGAIYVVDMYRAVIEHPRWISPGRLATLDVRAGADRGRIYRIIRADRPPPPAAAPALDLLATPALAAAIDSPNGTLRDTIQRVLLHRADASAVPVLAGLARSSPRAEARAQALCTLDCLGGLTTALIREGLLDPDPGVRAQAVRLAEGRLDAEAGLGTAVLALVSDPEIRVRYQLALSLGEWDDPRAGQALGALAVADGGDRWIRAAVLSSAKYRAFEILEAVLAAGPGPGGRAALLGPLLATVAGSGSGEKLARAVDACVGSGPIPAWRLDALASLLDASRSRVGRTSTGDGVRDRILERLGPAVAAARALARDPGAAADDRAAAIGLLARDRPAREADLAMLADLLGPKGTASLRSAALRRLSRAGDDRVAPVLLSRWAGLGPDVRGSVLDALLARPSWTSALITAMEAGEVRSSEIDAARRQRLATVADEPTRLRVARVLAGSRGRAEVVAIYRDAANRPGDAERGAATFARTCASCHRVDGRGHEVGPDLAALTDTSPEALAVAVFDPNREVDGRYLTYNVAMLDGRVASGLIAAEAGNSITLKRQDGEPEVVLRSDLDEIRNTGISLMPEGLEREITPEGFADLLAFLDASNRPKAVPGNRPALVIPSPDGTVRLTARSASIRGRSLVFESPFANLGYWKSPDDRATWDFRTDRAGRFTVSMEWACAETSAGEGYILRLDGLTSRGVVGATGSWSEYRTWFVREVDLPAGQHRLEIRAEKAPREALFDLRAVVLSPR